MGEEYKKKMRCPICDAEIDEDEVICPDCGSCIEEPAYDAIADEDDSDEQVTIGRRRPADFFKSVFFLRTSPQLGNENAYLPYRMIFAYPDVAFSEDC